MCGIYFSCGVASSDEFADFEKECFCMLKRRGPDVDNFVVEGNARFFSTVLWLQGSRAFPQPVNEENFAFLWNGDVYQYENESLPTNMSDTEFLVDQIRKMEDLEDILSVIQKIDGPWAFVLWDKLKNQLWFGRDFFGRQSLLLSSSDSSVIVCSCAPLEFSAFRFVEIPAAGIFQLDLDEPLTHGKLYPWDCYKKTIDEYLSLHDVMFAIQDGSLTTPILLDNAPIAVYNNISCDNIFEEMLNDSKINQHVSNLIEELMQAVKTRIEKQPEMCKRCAKSITSVPCEHTCVSVLFSGGLDSSIIALIAAKLLKEKQDFRGIDLLNVAFGSGGDESFEVPDRITGVQALQEIQEVVPNYPLRMLLINVQLQQLQEQRRDRIKSLLYPLDTVLDDSIGCAIWFAANGEGIYKKNFAKCNTSTSDGNNLSDELREIIHKSESRVVLSGMGIDEQLGGYSRHRIRYEREGFDGLAKELRMELLRISERNLGRDNRIISDHGVMARFPFLDEKFVNFLSTVPINLKCDPSLPRGIGEKLILRLAAYKLGLIRTAREPKRAVQFGSRIAKLENRKEKASDKAVRK